MSKGRNVEIGSVIKDFHMDINGIQHIGLPTCCYEETVQFYTTLGFTSAYKTISKNGHQVHFLKLKNLVLEVVEKAETKMEKGAIDHIALDVADVEDCYAYITGKGYTILEGEIQKLDFWENGVRYFTIEGPNKEKIEFSQYL